MGLLLLVLAACATPAPPAPVEVAVWGSSSAQLIVEQGGLAGVLGVPVYDGGVGGQVSSQIAARQGGAPAVVAVVGGVLPGTGTVRVRTATLPAAAGFSLPGTLAGVPGTLRSDGKGWVFDRRSPGPEVPVPDPTPLVSDAGVAHEHDATLLWMGKNDVDDGQWRAAAANTRAAYDLAQARSGRVLVLGHFANRDMTPGSSARVAFDALQQSYAADYGASFVDVEAYVCSAQIWVDTGVTPTGADLAAQQHGTVPPSLGDAAGEHLSTAAYHAVAERLLRPRLLGLGWVR